jgi:AraC-like DNA-binding protein
MNAGDVVVFPAGDPNVLSSSRGKRSKPNLAMYYRPTDRNLPFRLTHGGSGEERTRFVCGYLGCDARPFNPLLAALPSMLCVRKPADGSVWVTDLFRLALAEGGSGRAGGEAVLAKLSELMFVEIVRGYIETLPNNSRGWLSGLRDPHIGEALRLIHARPAEDWTLERIAREIGLSRSTFIARFTHYVEVSPMHYLAQWRLQLAARLIERPGSSIGEAAIAVGYESEAAFNRAFKKHLGVPPGAWRKGRSTPADAKPLPLA